MGRKNRSLVKYGSVVSSHGYAGFCRGCKCQDCKHGYKVYWVIRHAIHHKRRKTCPHKNVRTAGKDQHGKAMERCCYCYMTRYVGGKWPERLKYVESKVWRRK